MINISQTVGSDNNANDQKIVGNDITDEIIMQCNDEYITFDQMVTPYYG